MKQIYLLVFLLLLLFSCNENETPSQKTVEKIYNWYYSTSCINNTIDSIGEVITRTPKDNDVMISVKKIGLELDDSWEFNHQELTLTKISDIEYVFTIKTLFQKVEDDKDITLHTEMYYYELEMVNPFPIKKYTYQTINGESQFNNERSIWKGDFNVLTP